MQGFICSRFFILASLQTKGKKIIHGQLPPRGAFLSQRCWGNIDVAGQVQARQCWQEQSYTAHKTGGLIDLIRLNIPLAPFDQRNWIILRYRFNPADLSRLPTLPLVARMARHRHVDRRFLVQLFPMTTTL